MAETAPTAMGYCPKVLACESARKGLDYVSQAKNTLWNFKSFHIGQHKFFLLLIDT